MIKIINGPHETVVLVCLGCFVGVLFVCFLNLRLRQNLQGSSNLQARDPTLSETLPWDFTSSIGSLGDSFSL